MIARPIADFPTAFKRRTPAGICVGVWLPDGCGGDVRFAAGRAAATRAAQEAGLPHGVVGRDAAGRPTPVAGSVVSISHTRGMAVALVAPARGGRVGVDVESLQPSRPLVAEAVLTAGELEAAGRFREGARWTETLVRFSLKEAIYKATSPARQGSLKFHDVLIGPLGRGEASYTASGLGAGKANWFWFGRHVVTTVGAPSLRSADRMDLDAVGPAGHGERLPEHKHHPVAHLHLPAT
jgi:phosphopantetheinyl transferase (holo-ACP synthase)